jgi:hypothetical protein
MKESKWVFLCLFFLFLLITHNSCEFLEVPGFKDQALQGEIRHESYVFQSGYATTNTNNETLWTIHLLNRLPQETFEPWESGAYNGYPDLIEVWFSIKKSSQPKLYEVITLGGDYEDTLSVASLNSELEGSLFDKGFLEITNIDLDTGVISGRMDVDVYSGSEGSELNGHFTVPVEPEHF